MNHFTDGEWNLRLWRDAVIVSSEHWRGTSARVCRCRPIWRCPETQRLDRKPLTEMTGELWNTSSRQKKKLQIKYRECIALKHLIKCGGQKGIMKCCQHAGSNLQDLKPRTQDIVDNEVVQTGNQGKFECLTGKPTEEFEQCTVQSSTGDTAMAAGRPAPPDSHRTLAAVAESATTQLTTSSRTPNAKRCWQANSIGTKPLSADPKDRQVWAQQVVDRNKKCCGANSEHLGHLFESQKVCGRRIKEFSNIEKLEVAEIVSQETMVQATDIVYAGWLDDVAKGTPNDPAADKQ